MLTEDPTTPTEHWERLQALIDSGRLSWEVQEPLPTAKPLRLPGLRLSEALAEEREDRI